MYFDHSGVRHLDSLKPLQKPHLMTVSDRHEIDLEPKLLSHLHDLAFMQERYQFIPERLAINVRKLIAYKGWNPVYRTAGVLIRSALKLDLAIAGHGSAAPHILKGLKYAGLQRQQKRSASNSNAATNYSSGIGYGSEEDDLAIALRYKAWINAASHFKTKEERLGTQFNFAIENVDKRLKRSPNIKRFINFGACFGIVEAHIARLNPGVSVYGVDRAKLVKNFNDSEFISPNLHYVAADIMDFVKGHDDLSDTLFMFMRTAFIFPERFMVELMNLLGSKNVAAMIGIEPYCYSYVEKTLYLMSERYQPSIFGRSGMYLHNYPHLATIAGLRVSEEKWLRNIEKDGSHKDANRLYFFSAVRS